jgi:hypothetical protein
VPTSTTARAALAAATNRSAAPAPGLTGVRPSSTACSRAAVSSGSSAM